ncbi:MAG: RNA pseudouridine synthase [Alistipes sp.]|nr:RNA pseudouridine synthase [Alistipes sp.]
MLHHFLSDIKGIELPTQFTYPFHYTPHPLCRRVAEQAQQYLSSRTEWHKELSAGKMFGVLVVEAEGEIGYLAAFSGNLAGRNDHEYFVPAVYDMLRPDDFFKQEEANISAINQQIKTLESAEELLSAREQLARVKEECEAAMKAIKVRLAEGKALRSRLRAEGGYDEQELILASQRENAEAQREKRAIKERLEQATARLAELQAKIDDLKHERQRRSAELQLRLFEQFRMLNAHGEECDLCDIFAPTPQQIPPAGAGECAAPKLLQYAYKNGLRPIAMAEFWWGNSPKGEVRQHGTFYPACNGKCKPILGHMLIGLDVEPNPLMEIAPPEPKILWEDEWLVAIDKPSGMLSVRGKSGVRSAEEWAQERYPEAMIVHRLDQSTSGILVIAKNKTSHEALQKQFISRTVKKSYIALLDGVISQKQGEIRLPLKLDYDNRPRQMVAEDGRAAHTIFEVEGIEGGRTRVRFYPITGRTHQLRVHSAHADGLGTPIVGDDIYGTSEERLMLHAETIEFQHPISGETISLKSQAEF